MSEAFTKLTPEQAYYRERDIEMRFSQVESAIKGADRKVFSPMLIALEHDAIHINEGWGVRLYFFLRGLLAGGNLTEDDFERCMALFPEHSPAAFERYTRLPF